MQLRHSRQGLVALGVLFAVGLAQARGAMVEAVHAAPTAIPGAMAPLIEMQSASISNNGLNLTFTIQFFNPTVEGPSSGNADAVYGFFDLDTDKSAATGLGPGDLNNPQGGFGQYVDPRLGIDAAISLSSEGDFLGHPGPGMVDFLRTSDFSIIDTVGITYGANAGGGTLSFALPVADFATLPGFAALQGGGVPDFAAVVGNVNNATDVLSSLTAVPEPSALAMALPALLWIVRAARKRRPAPEMSAGA